MILSLLRAFTLWCYWFSRKAFLAIVGWTFLIGILLKVVYLIHSQLPLGYERPPSWALSSNEIFFPFLNAFAPYERMVFFREENTFKEPFFLISSDLFANHMALPLIRGTVFLKDKRFNENEMYFISSIRDLVQTQHIYIFENNGEKFRALWHGFIEPSLSSLDSYNKMEKPQDKERSQTFGLKKGDLLSISKWSGLIILLVWGLGIIYFCCFFRKLYLEKQLQRHLNEQLIQSEIRFRETVSVAYEFFWETDKNAHLIYLSQKTMNVLGFFPLELLGKYPYCLIHSDKRKDFNRWIQRIGLEKQTFFEGQWPFLDVSGNIKWLKICGKMKFNHNFDMIGYYGTALDITDQVTLMSRLLKAKEKLHLSTVVSLNIIPSYDY